MPRVPRTEPEFVVITITGTGYVKRAIFYIGTAGWKQPSGKPVAVLCLMTSPLPHRQSQLNREKAFSGRMSDEAVRIPRTAGYMG